MNEVTKLRELYPLSEVPPKFLTQQELEDMLRTEEEYTMAASSMKRERELYVAMSLVGEEVDFAETAIETSAENILGFYSPEDEKLYVIMEGENIFASEEVVYAHEYCHALQDQHFDLKSIIDDERNRAVNSDEALARRALVEGDATLLMSIYNYREIPQSARDYEAYRAEFTQNARIAANIDEDKEKMLESISPSLTLQVLFPYQYGVVFAFELFLYGGFSWEGVNAGFDNPPVSTEQVMHFDKYLAGEKPTRVDMPDLPAALGGSWHEFDRDVLGEIGLLVWLLGETDELSFEDDFEKMGPAAAGWGGDTYVILHDESERRVLAVKAAWDTGNDAKEFFEAFSEYESSVFYGPSNEQTYLIEEEPNRRIWEHGDRYLLLGRRGAETVVVVAPDRPTLDAASAAFGF
jgi:hypothetical protein